jgi:CheY-like chemotaxis protein
VEDLPVIMVVEDDQLVQTMVEAALADGGFEPAIAASGEEAVTLLKGGLTKYRALVLGLGKLLDIGRGILERDELATAGQGNGIVERPLPTLQRFHQPAAARGGFQSGGMRSPRSKRRYFSAVQSR